MTERCWDHPDHRETVARLRAEIEAQQVRNANLVEQMALVRDRSGTQGLQGLIHEMRAQGDRMSLHWADRLDALARGGETTPLTIDERFASERRWDAQVKAAQARKEA